MRKISFFLVLPLLFTFLQAQNSGAVDIDAMLENIDTTGFTSGILYNRTVQWANLGAFNDSDKLSSKGHFEQAVHDLYLASNQRKFTSYGVLRSFYVPDSLENEVDIGILNAEFHQLNYIEDNPNEGALDLDSENNFTKINTKEAFIGAHVFVAAPLKEFLRGNNVIFHFKDDLFFQEVGEKNIVSLEADFNTGTDYVIYENGNFNQPSLEIHYSEGGYKIITVTATFSDGSILSTESTFHVSISVTPPAPQISDGTVDASIPFTGYNESSGIFGHLEYRIFHGNPQGKLLKPIIIIDGFDPGDRRKIQDSDSPLPSDEHLSIEEIMTYYDSSGNPQPIIPILRAQGFDVVIVNHPNYTRNGNIIDGGADFIERNALTHVELYQQLNSELVQNGSNEQLVIVGPSMGGQISRFALSYMEDNNIPHNTRLWISLDSPHLGANIPIGLQTLLNQVAGSGNVAANDFVNNQLGSPAAKQQLIEQFNGWNGNQLLQNYMNAKTISQGFGVVRGHPFFTNYYNALFWNGSSGTRGYPQNLRKIALINGSLRGNKKYYNPFTEQTDAFIADGAMGLNMRAFQTVCLPPPFCWDLHIGSLEAFNMPNTNSNTKVSRFKVEFNDKSKYITNYNSRGVLDNAPGGWFPGFNDVAEPIDGADPITAPGGFWLNWKNALSTIISIISDLLGGADLTVYQNEHAHSFIPVISSLGFYNPDMHWQQELDRNLVCTGEIPFDSYFGPKDNELHTSFTEANITWLLAEINGQPQWPTVYLEGDDLNGPFAICNNDVVTYDFDSCKSPPADDWEVSSNLQIITSTNLSITVAPLNSNSHGQAFIKAIYPHHVLEKNVWIGKPAAASGISGPTEVDTGSMVSYHGTGAQGATSFKWWLPYPFDENVDVRNPINFNSDNWQTWPNQGYHNYKVFTGLGGHNGLVQFFGVNSCGEGGSTHIQVAHTNNGNCTTCYDPVVPYPNVADSHFNLDFSEYPEGTYYIYIYDAYSTVMYEGSSSNIEKTVATANIPDGVYFLHIHDGNEVIIKQLVIEH